MTHPWNNIPQVMRDLPCWCVSLGYHDKAPRQAVAGAPKAAVDNPATWTTFDRAAQFAAAHGYLIGFVFCAGQGLAVIDLDVKDETHYPSEPEKWTTQAQLDRHWLIAQTFGTYTEVSCGGKALHLVCLGALPDDKGARSKDHVEVYNDARYVVVTGNVLPGFPLEPQPRQELLNLLVDEIRRGQCGGTGHSVALLEVPARHTDEYVWSRLAAHQHSQKIVALCEGNLTGYPSGSEADLALIAYIANSTQSNEQVRRMFRQTALAHRIKDGRIRHFDNRLIDEALKRVRTKQSTSVSSSNPFAQLLNRTIAAQQSKAAKDAAFKLQINNLVAGLGLNKNPD